MAEGKQTAPIEPQPPETTTALRDKRITPEGVVPKQAQGYVIAGLAVLILMAVMFSKNHAKPAAKTADSGPVPVATDTNQRKIQELEQDLSADQRQSQQRAQRANTTAPTSMATATNPAQPGVAAPAAQLPPPVPAQATEPPRDPVADAEKAMAFKARFASNLVTAEDNASRPLAESLSATDTAPARSSSLPQAAAAQPAETSTPANKRAPEVNVNSAHG